MSVRVKLALSYLGIIIIFTGLAAYIVYAGRTVIQQMDALDTEFEQAAAQAHALDVTFHLLLTLQGSRLALHEMLLGEAEATAEFEATIVEFDEHLAQLHTYYTDNNTLEANQASLNTIAELAEEHEHFHEDAKLTLEWINAGDREQAIGFLNEELEAEMMAMEQQLAGFEVDADQRLLAANNAFDETVHEVEAGIAQLRNVTIALLILSVLAAIGLSSWLTQLITRPVNDLSATAISIEKGAFELHRLPPLTGRHDEFGLLARIFQRMAEEIHTREQALKQQVRRLQIKIDRTKHDKQVAEITGTDFFQQLEAKVARLRHSQVDPDPNTESGS